MANSIEIRLEDVSQLFETMDPFPFRDRDLARDADAYIFDWAHELPRNQPFEITIHLPASAAQSPAVSSLDKSIPNFFNYRAGVVGRELSDLFRVGRRTLLVGLAVLGLCLAVGQTLAALVPRSGIAHFFEEGLIIVGWVALWRPLEIFLYDWWPIAQNKKLYRRLAEAPVRVQFLDGRATSGGTR
ncbi:hypothetical protein [Aminobacter sp. AP02]|uniref:hypothetical protein n=1 Tax=Aminobacter sp. AP02 TaxID=2135737 RepID=UPI000D6A9DE6|nr:hypothetical protein [Aminobacter sp. AP02]PWK68983.1 hypothetical protein C8K44_10913 [Aminobacter sp. AP02]